MPHPVQILHCCAHGLGKVGLPFVCVVVGVVLWCVFGGVGSFSCMHKAKLGIPSLLVAAHLIHRACVCTTF